MITLRQSPGLWTPIYNPMVFVLDSDNTAQANFKYIADIYVSGVTDYVRLTIDADPTYSQGMADVHRIVESYVSSTIGNKTLSGFLKASNSFIAYEVKFGEQYGVASAVTNYPNLTVTGTKYAFNGAYTPIDWLDFNGANIAIENTGSTLTEQPNSRLTTMSGTEDSYLHYITNTSGSVYYAQIKTYDINGTLIQTCKIENDYQDVGAYDQHRMIFYAGVRGLNAATLSSGSQPVITASVYSYTVDLTSFSGVSRLNNVILYTKNDGCLNGRSPLAIHWKNYLGGFDSYQFAMVNRYKTNTKKTIYERKLGAMGSNSWSYNKYDAGKIAMDTKVQARYELQSDWISLTDQEYIMGLIESPEVYFDDGTNLIPVVVISPNEAEFKSTIYGDTDFNTLKVVVELAVDFWKQRG